MARHSFIRMTKLPNVKGRLDYISNPKRQEHLYAIYSTVEPEFWQYLSEQAQFEFRRSNQKTGTCIEGRELVIALPESMRQLDPDFLLKLFTESFPIETNRKRMDSRPESRSAELRFRQIDDIHQNLKKCNRKLCAL